MKPLSEFLPKPLAVLDFNTHGSSHHYHQKIKDKGFASFSYFELSEIIYYYLNEINYTPKQIKRLLRVYFNMNGSITEINSTMRIYYRMRFYFKTIPFEKVYRLFELALSKEIDYHSLLNAIPRPTTEGHIHNTFETMLKLIEKYNNSLFFNAVRFANYARIRNAANADQLRDEITYIEGNIERYTTITQTPVPSGRIRAGDMGTTLEKKQYSHAQCAEKELAVNKIKQDKRIHVSSQHSEISNIGSRTGCCFTTTGLASSLVNETILNPLACILTGRMDSDWFSMIWEIVVKKDGRYIKGLVLDNIEAHKLVDLEEIIDRLKPLNDYGFILLGTVRNDIKQKNDEILRFAAHNHSVKKPYYLMGGEQAFYSYSYDDSLLLYVLLENDFDKNYKVRAFQGNTDRDLFLAGYLEKFAYTTNEEYPGVDAEANYFDKPRKYAGDRNFLKVEPIKEASFLIESNTDIAGYLISHALTRSVMSQFGIGFEGQEVHIDLKNDLDKILYITDLVVTNFAGSRLLSEMFTKVVDYCNSNGYTTIAFSPNKHSEKLKKYVEKFGLQYIEDTTSTTFESKREF